MPASWSIWTGTRGRNNVRAMKVAKLTPSDTSETRLNFNPLIRVRSRVRRSLNVQ